MCPPHHITAAVSAKPSVHWCAVCMRGHILTTQSSFYKHQLMCGEKAYTCFIHLGPSMCICVCRYLVDSESDCVEVSPEASLPASIFLHQTDQDSAAVLAVVRVVIHILEPDQELRVGAERGCRGTQEVTLYTVQFFFHKINMRHKHYKSIVI